MTQDEIIKLALEAGFEEYEWSSLSGDSELDETLQVGEYPVGEAVFKFAALVAAAEREACAKVLDEMADDMVREMEPSTAVAYVRSKAAVIRAKGDKPCK